METVVTSSYTTTPGNEGRPSSDGRHSVLHDMVVGKDNIGFYKNQMREDTGDEEAFRAARVRQDDDPEDPLPPRLRLPSNDNNNSNNSNNSSNNNSEDEGRGNGAESKSVGSGGGDEDGPDDGAGSDVGSDDSNDSGSTSDSDADGGPPMTCGRCWAIFLYKFDNWIAMRKNQACAVVIIFVATWGIFTPLFHFWVQDENFDPRWENDEKQNETKFIDETMWEVYSMIMDPGSHVELESAPQRAMGSAITWVGVIIFSTIVGIILDAVTEKMEDLKQGKSTVVEAEHTLVIGWTDKTAGLCREIADANESEGGGVIVILDPLDKEELEMIYRNQVRPADMAPDGNVTKVVFRSGSALRATDLMRVSATTARSIVLLSDYGQDPDLADADILRVVLTLRTLNGGELNGHIVCEVRDVDNEPLVSLVGGEHVETVVSHDIIGRLMLMAARQPGIARVFNDVLGFEGDEFYTELWEECYGLEFQDVVMRFPDAVPIGYTTKDGKVELNPNKYHIMQPGEELIVIAEDDDTYKPETPVDCPVTAIVEPEPPQKVPEKILFCGWRRDVRDMMLHLDSMLAPGSELHMFNEKPVGDGVRTKLLLDDGFDVSQLTNMKLRHFHGNSAVKRHLLPVPLDEYSTAMILADQARENDMMHSDSHSLSSLLLIRDLQEKKREEKRAQFMHGNEKLADKLKSWNKAKELKCAIVCEILDSRTQETVSRNEQVSMSSDFVQSNKYISQILAMVSEDRNVKTILSQLLQPEGASIMVRKSNMYCKKDEELSFFQLQVRAMRLDKLLLGYQEHALNGATVINPKDKDVVKNWDHIDIISLEGHSEIMESEHKQAKTVLEAFKKPRKASRPTPRGEARARIEEAKAIEESGLKSKLLGSLRRRRGEGMKEEGRNEKQVPETRNGRGGGGGGGGVGGSHGGGGGNGNTTNQTDAILAAIADLSQQVRGLETRFTRQVSDLEVRVAEISM